MKFEDLKGKYLLLWNLELFEWPDNMLPYFEVAEGFILEGRMTCVYSEGGPDRRIMGSLYHDEVCGRICMVFDALTSDPECAVEGSFCSLYKEPSEEAMLRMQRATHYRIVRTSDGEYNLWLLDSEVGEPILKFAVADSLQVKA
ncbi:hypothetical protein [Pseudomonas gingeri]|uniref:Uncharacterized protein n=1 Tax=Pseudomonas gingeri TaxID=117681 RepID=A0A7Y8CLI3_9PSED|nr:hypothetical protein [Pseudomonas gingeri]NWB30531.1 hypothetical protein [Pseudomonas gingeri]NWC35613.1 hypothetical protein [Pseudomonas gingeri]NWD08976.1 hypothetical protein [Pseudomonas gingeri]NWD51551.1 hypothetical protein [Pseudomonas gingeri]NWE34807.1 hypothetical protein [Pseudomonas gingeri]